MTNTHSKNYYKQISNKYKIKLVILHDPKKTVQSGNKS